MRILEAALCLLIIGPMAIVITSMVCVLEHLGIDV
jgi:hypothetical protein